MSTQSDREADQIIAEALARIAKRTADKEAANKAWWAHYYEQLAKSTPNQGGAKHSRHNRNQAINIFDFFR
jgi:hypothetical protein